MRGRAGVVSRLKEDEEARGEWTTPKSKSF